MESFLIPGVQHHARLAPAAAPPTADATVLAAAPVNARARATTLSTASAPPSATASAPASGRVRGVASLNGTSVGLQNETTKHTAAVVPGGLRSGNRYKRAAEGHQVGDSAGAKHHRRESSASFLSTEESADTYDPEDPDDDSEDELEVAGGLAVLRAAPFMRTWSAKDSYGNAVATTVTVARDSRRSCYVIAVVD